MKKEAVVRSIVVAVIGGWGLLGVENLYHLCIIMLSNHLQTSDDFFYKDLLTFRHVFAI